MRQILLLSAVALLVSFRSFSQATVPYTTCPNVGIAIVRAGINAATTNPFYLYDVNTTTGAMTQVAGGPYKDPASPLQNLQVNAVGVNRQDGFIYGLSVEATVTTARLLRLDKNYGVTNLGYLPSPSSPMGQFGVINTSAGDMDDQGNYWFTAATVLPSGQLTGFYLGKVSNVGALSPGSPLPVTYYLVNTTSSCAAFTAALLANVENTAKDLSFNTASKTFFTYLTYSPSGAPPYSGQLAEIRPVAGSSPQQYEVVCYPVVNVHAAEVAGTLISNTGNMLVLLTDGTVGLLNGMGSFMYDGNYIGLANTGLPSPLRGDMGGCGGPPAPAMTWYRDFDGDGFGDPNKSVSSPTQPAGYVSNNLDCNDYRVYYEDKDKDGWGSGVKLPCGNITRTGDCDDNNKRVHSLQTFYRDADGDSWGNPAVSTQVCSSTPPMGYVANKMDCNDNDPKIRYCPTTMVKSGRNLPELQTAAPALSASPNPFGASTRMQYTVPVDSRVNIRVFDVMGREVGVIFQGSRTAGTYYTEYNMQQLSKGVYYCRMTATANGKTVEQTQKLVKLQ